MLKLKKIVLLTCLCGLPQYAIADVWAERQALAAVKLALSDVEALVATAKGQSNPEDRMTFNYMTLIKELRTIQGGIGTHLSVPMNPVSPSTFNVLSADYTVQN